MGQLALFGKGDAPRIDSTFSSLERIELPHGAWLDLGRAWLEGQGELFDVLLRDVAWREFGFVMAASIPMLFVGYWLLEWLAGGRLPLRAAEEAQVATDSRRRKNIRRAGKMMFFAGALFRFL